MLTLVLGGARSGKSRYAQELCSTAPAVVYVATARDEDDEEMRERIARHRADRPASWRTIEAPLDLERAVASVAANEATILVDCVTVWLSNLSWEHRDAEPNALERVVLERVAGLARTAAERRVVAVSNEVGCGGVPGHPVSRAFRDLQGLANQLLAREAERVVLMVAGCPLVVKDVRPRQGSLDPE